MTKEARYSALCLLLVLLLSGCASLGLSIARLLPDAARECPGRLLPAEQIEGDFRVRQRARVQNDDGLDWRLELIAEKRADLLVLVGLDSFGGKLFAVTQRGSALRVERPRGRLPRPPADLLRDFQRTRLAADAPPEPGIRLERPQPDEVSIEHERCGYRTRLVTLEETPLPPLGEPGLPPQARGLRAEAMKVAGRSREPERPSKDS